MPRGKHTKTRYSWDISKYDQTSVTIPKEITAEVKEAAQKIWEQRKQAEAKDQEGGDLLMTPVMTLIKIN